ncbi:hypothetical protein CYMTET_47704 [Cymbomonas tetramitiformis]|uniref:Uncharacterized protein n=1 Tax=Cymbomonas tetramitiformis TaxID=36881 RepID=A0AAE0EXE2_9CHLO|nr:hypothetical protein CYMTET_47704 [Cymbomonas tetramitiformis]
MSEVSLCDSPHSSSVCDKVCLKGYDREKIVAFLTEHKRNLPNGDVGQFTCADFVPVKNMPANLNAHVYEQLLILTIAIDKYDMFMKVWDHHTVECVWKRIKKNLEGNLDQEVHLYYKFDDACGEFREGAIMTKNIDVVRANLWDKHQKNHKCRLLIPPEEFSKDDGVCIELHARLPGKQATSFAECAHRMFSRDGIPSVIQLHHLLTTKPDVVHAWSKNRIVYARCTAKSEQFEEYLCRGFRPAHSAVFDNTEIIMYQPMTSFLYNDRQLREITRSVEKAFLGVEKESKRMRPVYVVPLGATPLSTPFKKSPFKEFSRASSSVVKRTRHINGQDSATIAELFCPRTFFLEFMNASYALKGSQTSEDTPQFEYTILPPSSETQVPISESIPKLPATLKIKRLKAKGGDGIEYEDFLRLEHCGHLLQEYGLYADREIEADETYPFNWNSELNAESGYNCSADEYEFEEGLRGHEFARLIRAILDRRRAADAKLEDFETHILRSAGMCGMFINTLYTVKDSARERKAKGMNVRDATLHYFSTGRCSTEDGKEMSEYNARLTNVADERMIKFKAMSKNTQIYMEYPTYQSDTLLQEDFRKTDLRYTLYRDYDQLESSRVVL